MISKKTLTTLTLAIAMSATISVPVFASTGDIYKLSGLTSASSPIYKKTQVNVTTAIQKQLNVSGSAFGYEGDNGQIYKLSDVESLYNTDGGKLDQTLADLTTQKTAVATVGQVTGLAVSSISATSTSSVVVNFNNTIAATDESALSFTFNGVAVPSSNVTYSGTTATLTGLTLVTSADGKTPAYDIDVMSGTTELSSQSVILKNLVIASVSAVPDVSVVQNGQPVLPSTVNVTYKDGSSAAVAVTWGSVVTSTVGTKQVVGKIAGTTLTAAINVNITAIEYVNGISLDYYSYLGVDSVNVQADSSVARISLNGTDMSYNGNGSFQFYTAVLSSGSTVIFNVYDASGNQIEQKKYVVQ